MVDGVADQVNHRVGEPFDDRAVQPRLLTDDPQLDLLAGSVGQVADDPREPREKLVDRDHPQVEGRIPDLPADALECLECVNPGFDPGNLAQAHQIVGHHDQLAGQPHQIVELRGVDPNPGVQPRQRRRRPRPAPAQTGLRQVPAPERRAGSEPRQPPAAVREPLPARA